MNFEDMQKVWNQEQDTFQYVIDEQKLTDQIKVKKDKVAQYASKMEWLMIFANVFAGGMLLLVYFDEPGTSYLILAACVVFFVLGGWMFFLRNRRIKNQPVESSNIASHLDSAIQNAGHIERLSKTMLVLAIPILGTLWMIAFQDGESVELLTGFAVFIALTLIAARWEHRQIHMKRKSKLIELKERLLAAE